MKNIKELFLNNNEIENIGILGKRYINIKKISILNLSYNNISNIRVMKKMFFENIISLYLNNNIIKSINPLENIYFPKLIILDISENSFDVRLQKNKDIIQNILSKNNSIDILKYDSLDLFHGYCQ